MQSGANAPLLKRTAVPSLTATCSLLLGLAPLGGGLLLQGQMGAPSDGTGTTGGAAAGGTGAAQRWRRHCLNTLGLLACHAAEPLGMPQDAAKLLAWHIKSHHVALAMPRSA